VNVHVKILQRPASFDKGRVGLTILILPSRGQIRRAKPCFPPLIIGCNDVRSYEIWDASVEIADGGLGSWHVVDYRE
jgi:hypothetical protein